MKWTLLHVNGFDSTGVVSEDYSDLEARTDYSPIYVGGSGWNGRTTYYNYGRMLWCWSSSWWVSPLLLQAPFERIGVHVLFGCDSVGASPLDIIRFWDSVNGTAQVTLRLVPSGQFYDLEARRGSMQIGSTVPQVISPGSGSWMFLSAFLEVSSGSGRLVVRCGFDDRVVMDYSGPTQSTSRSLVDRIYVGALSYAMTGAIDDLILYTAPPGTEPMPRIRVFGHVPPSSALETQWTVAGAGSNLDALSMDYSHESRYVSGRNAGLQDSYAVGLPSLSGRIAAVGVGVRAAAAEPGAGRNLVLFGSVGADGFQSQPMPVSGALIARRMEHWMTENPVRQRPWRIQDFSSGWNIGFRLE